MRMKKPWFFLPSVTLILYLAACAPGSLSQKTATPTPPSASQPLLQTMTPTPNPQLNPGQETATPSSQTICAGLSAEIEIQLYLPYAAAVDLDPIAVGTIPLSINTEQQSYRVQGAGNISYDETQTWTFEEGTETAEVFLELDVSLEGVCVEDADGGVLQLSLDAVHQEEHGSTTCSNPGECNNSPVMGPEEQSFILEFPIEDGATIHREDWTTWTFVIHLH